MNGYHVVTGHHTRDNWFCSLLLWLFAAVFMGAHNVPTCSKPRPSRIHLFTLSDWRVHAFTRSIQNKFKITVIRKENFSMKLNCPCILHFNYTKRSAYVKIGKLSNLSFFTYTCGKPTSLYNRISALTDSPLRKLVHYVWDFTIHWFLVMPGGADHNMQLLDRAEEGVVVSHFPVCCQEFLNSPRRIYKVGNLDGPFALHLLKYYWD